MAAAVHLIGAKLLDLRKRSVLMTVTVAVHGGPAGLLLRHQAIYHLNDPARYAPAGAPSAFATLGTLLAEFGFIVAAVLGATAGTDDLTDGMFRNLVITGRSRLALYLARVPAGLAILLSLAAFGFTVACLATAFLSSPHAAGALTLPASATSRRRAVARALPGHRIHRRPRPRLLMGQRTVPVVLLIVLQIIITPALADHALPYFVNGERLFVGVAMDQLKPAVAGRGHPCRPDRRCRAGDTADADLGDDRRHRRLDRRLAGHRRLEDDHPRRIIGSVAELLHARPVKGKRQR